MTTLSDSIAYQADCIESLKTLVDLSNGAISNQLSSINTLLTIVSIILALAGIIMGLYINHMHSKILKMKECVEESAKKTKEINEQIHSDFSSLYQQLKEEETLAYLNRLKQVPEDIANLNRLLLSRTLDDCHFKYLRDAYLTLKAEGKAKDSAGIFQGTYEDMYISLFHQHFLHFAILDDEIRDLVVWRFKEAIDACFKNDILKSVKDLCKALSSQTCSFDREVILFDYLVALNKSEYKDFQDLKDILQTEIKDKTILPNVIERCSSEGIRLVLFENIT